jgi:hypothetical protein
MLEGFVAHFPDDGRVPFARVLLALVALEQKDLQSADEQLGRCANLPPGSVRDLYTVARARRLRAGGDAEGALDLLRPLVGKNVDPIARTAFEEELTLAALATHREYEAISYMDAWLRASAEDEKERTVAVVSGLVERLPKDVLLGALQAMRAQRASYGYGVEIERILATRLVGIATASGNAELARTLLDPGAGAVVFGGDAGAELGALATSRRGLNSVEGRTIGLLLPTGSPMLRDESAAVLRGVMWAIGLPPGVRDAKSPAPAPSRGPAPSNDAGYACAPPDAARAAGEPSPAEGIRLVTRDDAGRADRTEVALDELVGEGAALIIAGVDAQTSTRALKWGAAHGVAVVALAPPDGEDAMNDFDFVVGATRQESVDALLRSAPSLAGDPVAPVVDASEAAATPVTPSTSLRNLLPVVSCDAPVLRAGDPRFPLAQWQKSKASGWLVSGSPACARDLLGELSSVRAGQRERGVVALALEAASRVAHPQAFRLLTASAGLVPAVASQSADEEVRRFGVALGDDLVTYWASLGRDAATLARVAVHKIPADTVTEAHAVAARRVQARDELGAAKTVLWSTEAAGWGARAQGPRRLKRTVCAVDVPVSVGRTP